MRRLEAEAAIEEVRVEPCFGLRAAFRPQVRIAKATRPQCAADVGTHRDAIRSIGRVSEERLRRAAGTAPCSTKPEVASADAIEEPA